MTTTTDKWTCRELAALLAAHGVRHAVVSPGSRNSPLIVALARTPSIECRTVIDERSAAFSALGMASVSGEPVAIVCTSGTALLDYAPAVAEAYYRKVALIVVSADRPRPWIDQDDSQTRRQPGILSHIVLKSYDFDGNPADSDSRWQTNRQINEGLLLATGRRRGPVHFNIALGEPLDGVAETGDTAPRIISRLDSRGEISSADIQRLAEELSSKKVLITVGFNDPDPRLKVGLTLLSHHGNFAVVTEATSNLHGQRIIDNPDNILTVAGDDTDSLRPDIVISAGGSLVSRKLKEQLRKWNAPHWRVAPGDDAVDCFKSLVLAIDADAARFFGALALAMRRHQATSDYGTTWVAASVSARKAAMSFAGRWSDLTAVHAIMAMLTRDVNLQVSNGMTLRHALSAPQADIHRFDCNRGVSGIDGSTSTAAGAAAVYDGPTVLLTGDMSAQYDTGALSSPLIPDRFLMIVIANGDGGIFRVIGATRNLPELDRYIAAGVNFPARRLAGAYGFNYSEATDPESLRLAVEAFLKSPSRTIIAVVTDSATSAEVTFEFYNHLKHSNI